MTDNIPRDVTAEELQRTCAENGITAIDHHDCAICAQTVRYYVGQGGELFFDPSCGCVRGGPGPERRGWVDAENWVNMQTSPAWKRTLAKRFGVDL